MKKNDLLVKKIKILLAQRDKQFKELAESVGMTQQGLRRSLLMGTTPHAVMLKVASFLQTTVSYLSEERVVDSKPIYRSVDKVLEEANEASDLKNDTEKKMLAILEGLSYRQEILEDVLQYYIYKYKGDEMSKFLNDGTLKAMGISKKISQVLNKTIQGIIDEHGLSNNT